MNKHRSKEKHNKILIERFKNNNVKFYDPKVDVLFKMIFGQEKDIAKCFINSLMPDNIEIGDISFDSQEIYSIGYVENLRKFVVDIYAKDNLNNIFLIEMQVQRIPDILGRAEFASSRVFERLYKTNDRIVFFKKIYSINLLFYDLYDKKDTKEYYHVLFSHKENHKNICMPFKNTICN